MAVLTAQTITRAGLAPSYAAAAGGGDTFLDNESGRMFVHAKNGSGGSLTVTMVSQASAPANSGLSKVDLAVAIPAGQERMIGPVSQNFRHPDTRVVSLTYSGVTDLTVAVLSLGG
jgi:hypothetical protein